jgi:hypothetical protein
MGVGDDDRVDGFGIKTERLKILRLNERRALKGAAINQDARTFRFDQIARTRDLAGGAVERNVHNLIKL